MSDRCYELYQEALNEEQESNEPNPSVEEVLEELSIKPMIDLRVLQLLQTDYLWTARGHRAYSAEFDEATSPWKHVDHALKHVLKAVGDIARILEPYDHLSQSKITEEQFQEAIADLVNCALRMANMNPFGKFDLMDALISRIESANGIKVDEEFQRYITNARKSVEGATTELDGMKIELSKLGYTDANK